MRVISNSSVQQGASFYVERQPCVIAVRKAKLLPELKTEVEGFIKRNVLLDCGRVPPRCLKAHIVKTAKKIGLSEKRIYFLKKLFRARIGWNGYYLDAGKLRRVDIS